ncbi:decapping endonuclease targeting mRNA [Thecaphora frezii]
MSGPSKPLPSSASAASRKCDAGEDIPASSQRLGKRPLSPLPPDGIASRKLPRHQPPAPILSRLAHPLAQGERSPFIAFPAFQQPQRLCTFSFDHDRSLHHDDRCKRYYRGPPPPADDGRGRADFRTKRGADLNYGFERFRQRDDTLNEHLDGLLASLRHRSLAAPPSGQRQEADLARFRADIVTWRGIATKLCSAWDQRCPAPGARTEGFELNAMVVEQTLYLEEYVAPAKRAEKAEREADERLKRFGYYGYSFESWSTVERPEDCMPRGAGSELYDASARSKGQGSHSDGSGQTNGAQDADANQDPPGWGGDVNTNQQWCYVVKTRLGRNRLILGGEVDCVHPPTTSPPSSSGDAACQDSLVELKTSMNIRPGNARDTQNFEAKLLKFYLQSFLLGVRTLVVGFRDPRGFLVTTQQFDTLAIPKMVRAGSVFGKDAGGCELLRQKSVWEPRDSVGFGDRILDWLREAVVSWTRQMVGAEEEGGGEAAAVGVPLVPVEEAVESYPVFRVSFQPPFDEVTLRMLERDEIEDEVKEAGKAYERVGFVAREYYEFVQQMADERSQCLADERR